MLPEDETAPVDVPVGPVLAIVLDEAVALPPAPVEFVAAVVDDGGVPPVLELGIVLPPVPVVDAPPLPLDVLVTDVEPAPAPLSV